MIEFVDFEIKNTRLKASGELSWTPYGVTSNQKAQLFPFIAWDKVAAKMEKLHLCKGTLIDCEGQLEIVYINTVKLMILKITDFQSIDILYSLPKAKQVHLSPINDENVFSINDFNRDNPFHTDTDKF